MELERVQGLNNHSGFIPDTVGNDTRAKQKVIPKVLTSQKQGQERTGERERRKEEEMLPKISVIVSLAEQRERHFLQNLEHPRQ